jgi:hypothetical protein
LCVTKVECPHACSARHLRIVILPEGNIVKLAGIGDVAAAVGDR